ncbi:transposase (plasmid) [Streptomyces sp. NBC_00536]|uniref:transposase n=1 Tax=Streptomyces sp. NBC_00536 TaxID=2975769 RepID=UPI002E804ED0|nr:transposase [Streptomyces sp. NBC_00536]WUC76881.1 transposase [Streptomyces sp. NBC_00536]WUC83516.1 transposase [Streptomyces sp. NBC_00536]WUC84072.1 transposase [Streptomyces sp. NBC_00536]
MAKRGADRGTVAVLRLGTRVRWEGERWTVVTLAGPLVTLEPFPGAGLPQAVLYRWLTGAADFALLDTENEPMSPSKVTAPGALEGLSRADQEQARIWHERLVEIDTGFAPGAARARPEFDPGTTNLGQRCAAMSVRLGDAGVTVSAHTLADKRRAWKAAGENAAVLLPKKRGRVPGGRTDRRVLAAMQEVVSSYARKSDVTEDAVFEKVIQLLKARYPGEMKDPVQAKALLVPRTTFYVRMKDTGLAEQLRDTTRRRTARAAKPALPHGSTFMRPRRPGEVTQIDTTPLRIVARGDDGKPVSVEMTTLVCVSTRSMCALMITPTARKGETGGGRATRAVDLTLLLAQCYAPWPVLPGWDPLSAAALSRLPFASLQAADPRFTEATAARPVIHPEMIVYDQGSPYASSHFHEVCARRRIALRPARKGTPTDKPLVERFFTTLATRFSQHVTHGWQGRSHHTRGRGVERKALYTIDELQHMAQEWVALEYQQSFHRGLRSPFLPRVHLSPNDMYAVQVARCGYRPLPLAPRESRKFLLAAWVKPSTEGFTVGHRTYQPTRKDLARYEEILLRGPSGRPGKNGRWECRYNPYRPERAWLYDHTRDGWVETDFIHRSLLTCQWTADMWQEAAERHTGAGGDPGEEAAIALALEQRRRRTRKPPPQRRTSDEPFQGLPLQVDDHSPGDRYVDLPVIDLSTLRPYPSLPVSPASQTSSVPAPSSGKETGEGAGADALSMLDALFATEGAADSDQEEASSLDASLGYASEILDLEEPEDTDVWDADVWEGEEETGTPS